MDARAIDRLRGVLEGESRVAYALLFGSRARGTPHAESDVDVALAWTAGAPDVLVIGDLVTRLERAAGRPVHLVFIDEAPPGLAYRVFRDSQPILVRDRRALVSRRARAILEYLDFRPVEEQFARAVLGRHGR
jgi:hypothetical protein